MNLFERLWRPQFWTSCSNTGGTPGSGSGSAGTANRGNGGNGAGNGTGLSGGNGGSGIVIISYIGSQAAVGGTVTTASGNTIHTFTGDGTFTANNTSYFVN